jgi:hypothetical protein
MSLTKKITLLVLFGISISQSISILYRIYPQIAIDKYDFFYSPRYREKITYAWFIYEIANIINRVIWCYAFSSIAKLVSKRLYYVGMLFMAYYLLQLLFYLWDRNTNALSSVLTYGSILIALLQFLIPAKTKMNEASNLT